MDDEGRILMERIDSLQEELKRLNIKQQSYVEMISHLRARVGAVERRKREIHYEVLDINDKVRAWEQVKLKNGQDEKAN